MHAQKKVKKPLKRKLTYVDPIFSSFSGQIEKKIFFKLNFGKDTQNTQKYSKILKYAKISKILLLLFWAFKA